MRKPLIMAIVLFLALFATRPLQAGTFGTAGILKSGHFALGLEPALTFSPGNFIFYVHGGLGLTRSIDLDLKLGLASDIYLGGELEFSLIRDTRRSPGLSFMAGAHGAANFGLDANLLLSNRFKTFSLYGALDADIEFVESVGGTDILLPMYLDIGVAIPISRKLEFLLEGNIALTNVAASGLSGGLMIYF